MSDNVNNQQKIKNLPPTKMFLHLLKLLKQKSQAIYLIRLNLLFLVGN